MGLSAVWFRAVPQPRKSAGSLSSFCDCVIGGMEPRDLEIPSRIRENLVFHSAVKPQPKNIGELAAPFDGAQGDRDAKFQKGIGFVATGWSPFLASIRSCRLNISRVRS